MNHHRQEWYREHRLLRSCNSFMRGFCSIASATWTTTGESPRGLPSSTTTVPTAQATPARPWSPFGVQHQTLAASLRGTTKATSFTRTRTSRPLRTTSPDSVCPVQRLLRFSPWVRGPPFGLLCYGPRAEHLSDV